MVYDCCCVYLQVGASKGNGQLTKDDILEMYSQYARSQAPTLPSLASSTEFAAHFAQNRTSLLASDAIPTPFDDMGPLQADIDYCVTSLQAYFRKHLARKKGEFAS